ncbi:MAG: hypothetical protein AAFY72_13535 [Cyanobacteria bacterium J06649_4]
MSDQSSEEEKLRSPEKLSTTDFLKEQGVGEFGTAVVFQGEVLSQAAEHSRLQEARADGNARRRLALLNFIFKDVAGILLVITFAISSGLILLNDNASEENRELASNVLFAISGAGAGYVFGKNSNKS